jgi:archaellum biogenesis ATPase FlaH
VSAELLSAKKEVIIVTGEYQAFANYMDIQSAVYEAGKKRFKFRIYSNSYLPGIARNLRRLGSKLYTGLERPKNQFMIIDGKEVVVFKENPPGSHGNRYGFITRRGVSKYISTFRDLTKNGRLIKRVSGPDPLDEWLAHPAWTNVPVDTSHMDGEFGLADR